MLQEVLLRIHRHRDELADADRVMAWVHRIARNAVIDHYRRRAARPERPAGGAEDLVERAGEPLDEPTASDAARTRRLPAPAHRPVARRPARDARADGVRGRHARRGGAPARDFAAGAKSRVQRGREQLKSAAARLLPRRARPPRRDQRVPRTPRGVRQLPHDGYPDQHREHHMNDLQRALGELVLQHTPSQSRRSRCDRRRAARKTYPDGTEAVRGVTFHVAAGEVLRAARPQRRRQVDDGRHARHAGAAHVRARDRGRLRRRQPARPRGSASRCRRSASTTSRRARAARPAGAPARAPRREAARRADCCSRWSTSPTWPTSASASSRAACSGASISPPR